MKICELFNQKYFIIDVEGYPQGLDKNSGGYPYCVSNTDVKFWIDKKEVIKYLDTLNWKYLKNIGPQEYFLCQVTDILAIKLVGSCALP